MRMQTSDWVWERKKREKKPNNINRLQIPQSIFFKKCHMGKMKKLNVKTAISNAWILTYNILNLRSLRSRYIISSLDSARQRSTTSQVMCTTQHILAYPRRTQMNIHTHTWTWTWAPAYARTNERNMSNKMNERNTQTKENESSRLLRAIHRVRWIIMRPSASYRQNEWARKRERQRDSEKEKWCNEKRSDSIDYSQTHIEHANKCPVRESEREKKRWNDYTEADSQRERSEQQQQQQQPPPYNRTLKFSSTQTLKCRLSFRNYCLPNKFTIHTLTLLQISNENP